MKRHLKIERHSCNISLIDEVLPARHFSHYVSYIIVILVSFTMILTGLSLTPVQVYSDAEDRRQFHGELRDAARSGLSTNYWSFHSKVFDASPKPLINMSGVDPVSNSSKIFGPLLSGDDLFIGDPARFFPESELIRVIVTQEPASAAGRIEVDVFCGVPGGHCDNVEAEDNEGVVIDQAFPSSTFELHFVFTERLR